MTLDAWWMLLSVVFLMSFMLSVAIKYIMLGVVMLNVIMLIVILLNVVARALARFNRCIT